MPPQLVGDPLRIRQILTNLVGNAVKFTKQGRVTLEIRSELRGEQCFLELAVVDTGSGIPASVIPLIWEPYAQAGAQVARTAGATGLGLPISRKLARQMDGDIHVFSTPGEGSRFVVTLELPVARESPPPPEPDTDTAVIACVQESVPAPRETKTDLLIALVDDNPTGRAVGRAFLARLGYGADVHESGMSLLEAVKSGSRPDLVFMDIRMPVMDGFEATRRLLEHYVSNGIRPPVVAALSADAIPEVRQRCLREGMDFFLSKPTQLSDLKRVIGEVASRRSGSVPSR